MIFDAFKGHKGEEITTLHSEKHLHPVLVLNNCKDQLQPIDLPVNKPFKDHLQKKFTAWYADKVKDQLDKGVQLEDCNVDPRLSILKEVEAMWMVLAYDYIKSSSTIIQNGFKKAGILDAVEGRLDDLPIQSADLELEEDPFRDLEED